MKKPCVAVRNGGTPEIFGDTGILTEPKNPGALKEAIKKYANDPELMNREAEKGRERAVRLFNSEKIYNDKMKEDELHG
jgi:glycosyltransferase involved in cell wall biosynthesis